MARRAALVFALVLAACGGGGGGGGGSPSPPPSPPPGPSGPVVFLEPQRAVTFVEGPTVNYRVTMQVSGTSGSFLSAAPVTGEDASVFTTSSTCVTSCQSGLTVELRFRTFTDGEIDYEFPRDANGDNVYNVTFGAIQDGVAVTRPVTITITDKVDVARVTREATGLPDPAAIAGNIVGEQNRLALVADRSGRIYRIANGVVQTQPFLDLSAQVSTQAGSGILGMLVSSYGVVQNNTAPTYLYVLMSNLDGDTEMRAYHIEQDLSKAIPSSARLILRVDYPDGSTVAKGGFLMAAVNSNRFIVGVGDGGSAADAQNPFSLRGKVLRILADTGGDAFPADPDRNFRIPPENPMASGASGFPEIWAMGVRNPVSGGFNRQDFAAYFVDAGETLDEVNKLPFSNDSTERPYFNFGWPRREGTGAHNGGADDPAFLKPIAQRAHTAGSTMVGGYAYYGRTELYQGEFFFGDPLAGGIYTFTPRLVPDGQTATSFTNRTVQLAPNIGTIDRPRIIAQDDNYDLFIVDSDGELFKYHATWY